MLRHLLFATALLLCLIGTVAVLVGHHGALPLAAWSGVIAAAVWLERWRYRNRAAVEGDDWQPTDERFVDPASGQLMQVFYNPRTGERRYDPAPHG